MGIEGGLREDDEEVAADELTDGEVLEILKEASEREARGEDPES